MSTHDDCDDCDDYLATDRIWGTRLYTLRVHWTEEPCDSDDPTSALVLSGTAEAFIRETEEDPEDEFFEFPVAGAPEDFDAQLDAGLAAEGWHRTSPLRFDWVNVRGAHNARGKCYVAPSDTKAAAMLAVHDLSAPTVLRAAAELMEEGLARPQEVDADVQIEEAADWSAPTRGTGVLAVKQAREALVAYFRHRDGGDPFACYGAIPTAADLRAAADHAEARAS